MNTDTAVLASDLDGTLIPTAALADDGGIEAFGEAVEAARPRLTLAYVTGRHRSLAVAGVEAHGLPPADILVCDVGTSVFFRTDGELRPDPEYRRRMAAAFGNADRDELACRLLSIDGLRLQEHEKQSEFKLSFYTPPGAEGKELAARAEGLVGKELGAANLVFSVEPGTGRGLLDVLPPGVAKDVAVRYLHARLGTGEDRLVYAGDSGNDRAPMLSGFKVVVVGNAPEPLKDEIRDEAAQLGLTSRIYFARASLARGVLEGARHFGIL